MSKTYQCDRKCCTIKEDVYNGGQYIFRRNVYKSGVFIYDPKSDKILIVQSRGQFWGPPKGTLESSIGETYPQCALREVKEETGITLELSQLERCVKIKNRAMYYYAELSETDIDIQNNLENDANGIGWIKIDCLRDCIESGKIMINQHCRLLVKKFLNRSLPITNFIKVKNKKNK